MITATARQHGIWAASKVYSLAALSYDRISRLADADQEFWGRFDDEFRQNWMFGFMDELKARADRMAS